MRTREANGKPDYPNPCQRRRAWAIPIAVLLFVLALVLAILAIWTENAKLGGTAAVLIAPIFVCLLCCVDWDTF